MHCKGNRYAPAKTTAMEVIAALLVPDHHQSVAICVTLLLRAALAPSTVGLLHEHKQRHWLVQTALSLVVSAAEHNAFVTKAYTILAGCS